jgi:hypothetical protein
MCRLQEICGTINRKMKEGSRDEGLRGKIGIADKGPRITLIFFLRGFVHVHVMNEFVHQVFAHDDSLFLHSLHQVPICCKGTAGLHRA